MSSVYQALSFQANGLPSGTLASHYRTLMPLIEAYRLASEIGFGNGRLTT